MRHPTASKGDRMAEWVSRRIGSTPSIIFHSIAFASCFVAVGLRLIGLEAMLLWLTTVVSLEAIYIGLFLQNSSNRHGDRSEANARHDAATNIKAEKEIEELQQAFMRLDKMVKYLISTQTEKIDW